MTDPQRTAEERRRWQQLADVPARPVDVVMDTDTYNEIDDQFAVVYSLLSAESMNVQALYAAPFTNSRSTGPEDGMRKSYEEIERLLSRMKLSPPVFEGSTRYMTAADDPVPSAAASDLIERAGHYTPERPLYVLAIGAPTNVASAIVTEPAIAERIVVVWLGGHAHWWPHSREFNFFQDIWATRTLFDSGVALVQIPCMGVTSHLHTTLSEMKDFVSGKGSIGDYLYGIFESFREDHAGRSKVIWDISTVAYVVNSSWTPSALVQSPVVTDQFTYSFDRRRHMIRCAYYIDRDAVFRDLFAKLARHAGG